MANFKKKPVSTTDTPKKKVNLNPSKTAVSTGRKPGRTATGQAKRVGLAFKLKVDDYNKWKELKDKFQLSDINLLLKAMETLKRKKV